MRYFFTLAITAFCFGTFAQVSYKVALLPDEVTYEVSLISSSTHNTPTNTVSTAQVSLVVPTGGFEVGSVNSLNGLWSNNTNVAAPPENPDKDYIIFALQGATSNITMQTGVETPLFTFENTGSCTGALELLENDVDPFYPPNSLNVNVGNQMSIPLVVPPGTNGYTGNTEVGGADCTDTGGGGGSMCDDIVIHEVTQTSPTTCGSADGSIAIAATGGPFTLQYSIDGGDTWQSNPFFPDLAAGNIFEIHVRDIAALCLIEWGLLELQAPIAAALVSDDIQHPTCQMEDGVLTVEAIADNGGPLEFSNDNRATWQPSNVFTDLAPGLYPTWVRNLTSFCETKLNDYLLTEDCSGGGGNNGCIIEYRLDELPGDIFQVSMTPDESWTFPNNITSTAQVTIKVITGGFDLGSLVSQIPNVTWNISSIYVAPPEDPLHDYITISLASFGTTDISYEQGVTLPMFTFENLGICTGGEITLMKPENELFLPPNSQNANVGPQITTAGGGPDVPVCIFNTTNFDCDAGPCMVEITEVNPANPIHCNDANGVIIVVASGSGVVQYSIDGGTTWQANGMFENVPAGSYNVMVQVNGGVCDATFANNPIVLADPDPPTIITPAGNVSSCGGENVLVSVEISEAIMAFNVDGTGDFTNTIIDGNTAMFEAIPIGNSSSFTVEIMGLSGCTVFDSFEMDVIDAPSTTFSAPILDCTNNEVTIEYLGNAPASSTLVWNLDGGIITSSSPATANDPEGATITVQWAEGGMKNIQLVINENGCEVDASSIIDIQDIATTYTATSTDIVGCDVPNGSIEVVLDSLGNYTFNWEGPNMFMSSSDSLIDLEAGDYLGTITNADNGCTELLQFTIAGSLEAPDTNAIVTQPDCEGNGGTIELTNAPAGATFAWSGGLPDASLVSGLISGAYTVTITNTSGCTAVNSFNLIDSEPPVLSIIGTTNIDCHGSVGSVTFLVENPGIFNYRLNEYNGPVMTTGMMNGGDQTTLMDLPMGLYQLFITDDQGNCEVEELFGVNSDVSYSFSIVATAPSGCGISDAQISVTILDGGTAPFVLSSDFGNIMQDTFQSINTIEGLYDQTVIVTIIDDEGCETSTPVPLGQIPVAAIEADSILVTHNDCPSNFTGSILTNTFDTSIVYEVMDTNNILLGLTPLTGLAPGTYTVLHRVDDCLKSIEVEITGTAPWEVDIATIPESCEGNDGSITVTASGGTGGLTYEWSNGIVGTNALLNLSESEVVDLVITDAAGCTNELVGLSSGSDCIDSPCLTVFTQSTLTVISDADITEVCLPTAQEDISSMLIFVDGSMYLDLLGDCDDGQTINISGIGLHTIAVMDASTECIDSILVTIQTSGNPRPDTIYVEVIETLTETVCLNADDLNLAPYTLNNLCGVTGIGNALLAFTDNPTIQEDLCIEILGNTIGSDMACMLLCDAQGLCDTTIIIIEVLPRDLIIYTGFSPNRDGFNDHFHIENIDLYPNNRLRIFNRMGMEVFQQKGYSSSAPWEGIFEGKDLPDGTYFYMLEDGEGKKFQGYLQLMR